MLCCAHSSPVSSVWKMAKRTSLVQMKRSPQPLYGAVWVPCVWHLCDVHRRTCILHLIHIMWEYTTIQRLCIPHKLLLYKVVSTLEIVESRSQKSYFILRLMSFFLSALLKNPFIISVYLSSFLFILWLFTSSGCARPWHRRTSF